MINCNRCIGIIFAVCTSIAVDYTGAQELDPRSTNKTLAPTPGVTRPPENVPPVMTEPPVGTTPPVSTEPPVGTPLPIGTPLPVHPTRGKHSTQPDLFRHHPVKDTASHGTTLLPIG
jgi:hypothetical protein